MDSVIFLICFFFVLFPLVLGIVIPIFKNHRKTTGSVINYDSLMRKYIYKIYMTKEEFINTLQAKSDIDDLSCYFDLKRSIIKFAEYGSSREYFFTIKEYDGYSVLRLEQVALIGMQSHVPYKLNPFLVGKLKAELLPFAQYAEQKEAQNWTP